MTARHIRREIDRERCRLADLCAPHRSGYQAESGPWRGVYLMGAYELRHGVS